MSALVDAVAVVSGLVTVIVAVAPPLVARSRRRESAEREQKAAEVAERRVRNENTVQKAKQFVSAIGLSVAPLQVVSGLELAELGSDQEIRRAIRRMHQLTDTDPLQGRGGVLDSVNLVTFFRYVSDHDIVLSEENLESIVSIVLQHGGMRYPLLHMAPGSEVAVERDSDAVNTPGVLDVQFTPPRPAPLLRTAPAPGHWFDGIAHHRLRGLFIASLLVFGTTTGIHFWRAAPDHNTLTGREPAASIRSSPPEPAREVTPKNVRDVSPPINTTRALNGDNPSGVDHSGRRQASPTVQSRRPADGSETSETATNIEPSSAELHSLQSLVSEARDSANAGGYLFSIRTFVALRATLIALQDRYPSSVEIPTLLARIHSELESARTACEALALDARDRATMPECN